MCGNNLGKRLILFSLTFALGVLSVNFFVSNKLPESKASAPFPPAEQKRRETGQKSDSGVTKSGLAIRRKCFPVETDSEKTSKNKREDLARYRELVSEKARIKVWLLDSPRASEREFTKHLKRLEIIEKKLRSLKNLDEHIADSMGGSRKLLYVEECYEF